jgi:predicted 3-demethylubiquinone-9 3-methyltransferase (glyoxalase superfamily)
MAQTSKHEMAICLWFDNQAEEAARFYASIFHDSEIGRINTYGKEGFEFHQKPEGSVMTVEFRLNKMHFLALNGGPIFNFNEAVSIMVNCDNQEEIDHYWNKLTEGGEESQCGWLKDKYGVSWQIVPRLLTEYMTDHDSARRSRVERAFFKMRKLIINDLSEAYHGVEVTQGSPT